MKICLVAVLGGDLVRSAEHVGLGMIAAYLREKGHQVSILEVKNAKVKKNYENLLPGDYDLVGFTTTCITLADVLTVAKNLKDCCEEVKIVLGGHMATFSGREILEQYPQIDYIISGEGEITFDELVTCLEQDGDLSKVKGIYYRRENEVIRNEDRELIPDLDALPFPARDQFLSNVKNTQYIRISTSRGCYGGCAFCSNFVGRKQKGPWWRGRSPKNVVDEIEQLVQKYEFHTFDFVDSSFEDPGEEGKKRIGEIANEIINRKLNIYYNCCFRAENWKDEDKPLLDLLIQSGLEKVNIGFESGNDRGLKILNKRARMADNWKVIEVLRDFADIYITFGFIMLHPYSTMEDLADNAKFLYKTGIGQVIRHYFWQLEVYPGTLMEEKLIKDELLLKEYDVTDGMYKYKFIDSRVTVFPDIFKSILELDSVWDFEIFDIIIHTFITRLRREYKNTEIFEKVEKFRHFVNEERKAMAEFNFKFFMRLHREPKAFDVEKEKELLDNQIKGIMDKIRKAQYQLGHEILKLGRKLINR